MDLLSFEQKKQCFVTGLFSNNLVTRSSIHNVSAVTYVKDKMPLEVIYEREDVLEKEYS